MNKIKKIVLPVMCVFFISPACTIKASDLKKGALSAVGILVGSYAIVKGGLDVRNAEGHAYRKELKNKLLKTVGIIKIAAGSIITALCLKYLIEKYLGYKVTFSIGGGNPSYRFKHFGYKGRNSGLDFF